MNQLKQIKASRINLIGSMIIYLIIIAAFIASCQPAAAQSLDFNVGIPNSTTHAPGRCLRCNENNHLISVGYTQDKWGVTAARFVNSYNNPTTAVAATYTYAHNLDENVDFVIRPAIGVMLGYEPEQVRFKNLCQSAICPMVAVSTGFLFKDLVSVNMIHFGNSVRTLTVGLKVNL